MSEEIEEVVIDSPEEETEEAVYTKEELEQEGVDPNEVEGLGLLKAEEEEKEEVSEKKPVEGEFNIDDLDSFEKVHALYTEKKEDFQKLPRHVKALYHNSKGLYKSLKSEEERRKELETELQFGAVKEKAVKVLQARLEKINALLDSDEELTVDQIKRILNDKTDADAIEAAKTDAKPKMDTPEAEKEKQAKFVQSRMLDLKETGDSLYDNFDDLIKWADEVAKNDPTYGHLFLQQINDPKVDTAKVAETIYKVARLNDNFGKTGKKPKDEKVTRIIKNANKPKSSAALNSGGGKRVVSYDDLSPEDVVNMTTKQYAALPAKVRQRLDREIASAYDD